MSVKKWQQGLRGHAHAKIWKRMAFCLLAAAIGLLLWTFRPRQKEPPFIYTSAAYRSLPKDSLDVLAIGSQRMQTAFNPASYYSATGFYGYVLHAPCNTFSDSYQVLKEALNTQHPAVVLIDVSPLLSTSRACIIGDHVLRNTNADDEELGYVYQSSKENEMQDIETYDLRYKPALSAAESSFVTRLASLCQSHHATPVFINPPFDQNQFDADKLAAINEYILRKHLTFIDFNSMASSIGYKLGRDGNGYRANTWGAEIVTTALVEQTADLVKNHHANALLEESMMHMVQETMQILFAAENSDVGQMLQYAEKYPVISIIQCRDISKLHLVKGEEELLAKLGLDCKQNGSLYAIIDHGNIVRFSTEPFAQNYNGWKIELTKKGISVNDESMEEPAPMHIWLLSENPLSNKAVNRAIAVTKSVDGLWQKD